MTDDALLGVTYAVVVVVVVVCATTRPGTADAVAKVLLALAAVFSAVWPWMR